MAQACPFILWLLVIHPLEKALSSRLTDSSLSVGQMRRNNEVPFLPHTHVHQSRLHSWDNLVSSQHNVVGLPIVVPVRPK